MSDDTRTLYFVHTDFVSHSRLPFHKTLVSLPGSHDTPTPTPEIVSHSQALTMLPLCLIPRLSLRSHSYARHCVSFPGSHFLLCLIPRLPFHLCLIPRLSLHLPLLLQTLPVIVSHTQALTTPPTPTPDTTSNCVSFPGSHYTSHSYSRHYPVIVSHTQALTTPPTPTPDTTSNCVSYPGLLMRARKAT